MNTIGVEPRWGRTARIGPRIGVGRQLLALSVCLAVIVFGAFFGIGRLTRPGKGIRVEGAPSLPVAPVGGAVPAHLASAPPLEGSLVPPPPRPRVTHRSTPFSPPAATAPLQSATAQVSPPHPGRAAPAPSAPVPSEPAPASPPSGGGSSSSGGGAFESSG